MSTLTIRDGLLLELFRTREQLRVLSSVLELKDFCGWEDGCFGGSIEEEG